MTDLRQLDADELATRCADLIRDAGTGGPKSPLFEEIWEELYRRHRDLVFWILRTSTHDLTKEDIEDITQEVFFRLYRHIGSFRASSGSIKGLLRSIVNSARVDWLRAQRAEQDHTTLVDDLMALTEASHDRGPGLEVLVEAIAVEFRKMSTRTEQRALQMLLNEDSIKQISETLGVTEYRVKAIRSQAKRLLEDVSAEIGF